MSVMRTLLRILGQFGMLFLGFAPGAPKEQPEEESKRPAQTRIPPESGTAHDNDNNHEV